MSLERPLDLLHDVYDEELGLRLTNFSIKPVHVANGLARSLTERSYDTQALAETLRRWVAEQRLGIDVERFPNELILERYGEAFEAVKGSALDAQRLNRLRALGKDLLAADGAVFPEADKSSYTLTNERFISRDPSDVRAGLFLARLLRAEPTDRTQTADLFVSLLSAETDAWTTLALPLLELAPMRQETLGGDTATRAAKADHLFATDGDGRLASPVLARLRDAFDRLARFETTGGSKLNSMRRIVLFGCFVIHVHAISRWHERNPDAPRPPILLDMSDGERRSVRDASRATLRCAGDALEGLVLERFARWVETELGTGERQIRAAMESPGAVPTLARDFATMLASGREPVGAAAQALVDVALSEVREHPIGALIELGRRAGFLTPWSNRGGGGKMGKRYCATAEFLETLVAATVEPEDPVEFPEFLERVRESFGIVVGQPLDDGAIRANNLHGRQFGPPVAINEDHLRRNVEELRTLLVETGYAKAYADGRTVITTAPEGIL